MKKSEILKLVDVDSFLKWVDTAVSDTGCTHLDAVEQYCHNHEIDYDLIAQVINRTPRLKSAITDEGKFLRLLKNND